ncbi:phenylalanine--tRNA ligase subunit beta [Synechococcus sp. Cruz-9H2]|uniref:phenylalanine--tRNA ligase subunit beta n=1 Tax=unclassified Synechococcus TaxID=2626047 RepID=UPI0020CB9364|nr:MULTISPECIES: phenylalanine--tRNA ligase subunit beta [unclassified Synechococcus]MCP9818063.1 phenylalanine--tRNA ligase subunit beta [Synechococcus sp. Cruz-9H2]MCP9842437.1 phenylalanine--tRNA ligase subunit beta [Synechococcus sp. Edmonson 11F2]MCP9854459.1 phenylalanine--tRNA ligase subunit beta [Synechococcus sp. Cruz-9C9]MCP9861845.1 phenylalanine--tRNA ligase subunit beta [Synechococcus sp. Cruz-7E5]MCP9868971.1 phenylalanine--tRNA ligase subunit beta [Synechococcus sp. Cruz-7B9]
MRVSLQWLRELVSCDEPVQELAERLSIAGFEVEAIDDLASQAEGVVVGYVEDRQPHPDADRLSVCQLRVSPPGSDQPLLQVVCGAANVRAGIHVPVALVGAHLSAVDLTIQASELRGVASTGMICSLKELGLADSSDGIAVLDELLETVPPLGAPVAAALGLDDQVLELAITANRPDGLSMLGIAREVAALTGGQLSLPPAAPVIPAEPLPVEPASAAAIETGGLFSLTALTGVRVEPSPAWLQRRLERAGLRPINNVVDITNLVMLETGQPLHAFDQGRLAVLGGRPANAAADSVADPADLGLRSAHAAEAFEALDGSSHQLSPEALVVTYANQPIALAGVIGGAGTAVQPDTETLWLEAAMFSAEAVRRSARSVGLRTDASARFEKGLPLEVTLLAADRAVQLLQNLAGARVQGRWLHQRPHQPADPMRLRRDALHNLLGPVLVDGQEEDLAEGRIEQTLTALGCNLQADEEGWLVTVPPSRSMDLTREVDLIEEVARLVGYDHFASHLPDPIEPGGLEAGQQAERWLRQALCHAGLQETCAFSLVPAQGLVEHSPRLGLTNPLLTDYGHLRDSLLDELLLAARRNLQASMPGFWAFEIGRVFQIESDSLIERSELAGVLCGERRSELWSSAGKGRSPDYFEARGVLQQALATLKIPCEDRATSHHPLLHPGRAAELLVEGRVAGWFGQLHPERAEALDLPEATHLFQLALIPLLSAATRRNRWQPAFAPFATVPASERDLALVVPDSVTAAQLLSAIRKAGKPLLESAELIDRYQGSQVEAGNASQAFRLRYRDARRTLTESEVEQAHTKILGALQKQFGAARRS